MSAPGESRGGIWAAGAGLLESLLATAQNRVELLAVEVQEEKCRVVEAILCAAALAAFGMMSLTLVTFTLVVAFWESARVAVLIGLSGVYLLAALWAWRALRLRLRRRTAFSGTLHELTKDRACLKAEN